MVTHDTVIVYFFPCPAKEMEWQSGFGRHLASGQNQPTTVLLVKAATVAQK